MTSIGIPAGTVFGRLTVIGSAYALSDRHAYWLCRCECGRETTVRGSVLRSGNTKSCGCLQRDWVRQLKLTHGVYRHEHYILWRNIMTRCLDPGSHAAKWYGDRGITVCPEWRDAAAFCVWMDANMGPRPPGMSFDRIRNDSNYEPGNVRWNDAAGQIRNSRQAKLTMGIAEEIRRRYAAGERQRALAAEFGIGQQSVSRVVTGQTWVRH
jgi:hypothetical protein